jgi:hypothetical protein
VWRERVEQYIDLNQVITYVATENFLSEWDGFAGNYGMNNFYLYRPAGSTKHRLLPWDKDNTMLAADSLIFFHNDEHVLMRRAMQFSDLRELYLLVMEQCAQSAAQDDWLVNQLARSSAVVAAAGREDPRRPYPIEQVESDTQFVARYAAERPAYVLQEVAKARAAFGGLTTQVSRTLVPVTPDGGDSTLLLMPWNRAQSCVDDGSPLKERQDATRSACR